MATRRPGGSLPRHGVLDLTEKSDPLSDFPHEILFGVVGGKESFLLSENDQLKPCYSFVLNVLFTHNVL